MDFNLKNKRVTVIGAARSGIAVANVVCRLGGKARVSEFKPRANVEKELAGLEHPGQVAVECGGHTEAFIKDSDYVVLSPGVRAGSAPARWARSAGIEVMGEIEFAFRLCPCPIVAVTGSNGKTTTVTVIAEIFKKAGRRAVLCGNIGSPFSKHVLDLNPGDTVVLEISSFQLESTVRFKPHAALWLNFSQNHLDRHKDAREYFDAKKKIFVNQDSNDWAVLNAQQDEFKFLAKKLKAQVIFFNDKGGGAGNPNFLAAMAAAKTLGISEDVCRTVFAEFKGVEHRQEFVRALDGVDYINDSKSTTPEAGRWALTHLEKPMVMICGGSDKHLDFSPLKSLVKARVKKMIVIGQTREALRATFMDVVPVEVCGNLPEAVEMARRCAQAGDCVALSPMCASYDMFSDYEHRGRVFKEIVRGLK
ncbi:MAG: UDP-N-acetylmuramoyl-L-alanine--D-glutamate ligase [Candidatus Omnitrophica bacterium]|nr:UDP-N-acetylmuramoyl-L-alanine--D-glutamate ligase [Candidatus Omnitrophota bacterium]